MRRSVRCLATLVVGAIAAGLGVTAGPASAGLIVGDTYTIMANDPGSPIVLGGGSQRISDIVIQEVAPDAIEELDLTFTLRSPGSEWDLRHEPTARATGGDARVASVRFDSRTVLRLTLASTSGFSPAEYRISGLRVTATEPGEISVDVASSERSYGLGLVVAMAMSTQRIGGVDRYATAAFAYNETVGGCNANQNVAVLARGDIFADAVLANYVAGLLHTGVLLTKPDELPRATIDQLRVSGVYRVYVIGSTTAVSQRVRDQLAQTVSYICDPYLMPTREPIHVVDVPAGADRYATAALVAGYYGRDAIGQIDIGGESRAVPLRTAVLANGENFPDALAAGPMSYDQHLPLLLTKPERLSPEAEEAIRYLGIEQVLIVGDSPSVSAAAEARVKTLGLKVMRLAGEDRAATAIAVAGFALAGSGLGLGFDPGGRVLVRGDNFPDALVMGALAGSRRIPLLLAWNPTTLGKFTVNHLVAAAQGQPARTPNGESDAVLGPAMSIYIGGDGVSISPATVAAALTAASTR